MVTKYDRLSSENDQCRKIGWCRENGQFRENDQCRENGKCRENGQFRENDQCREHGKCRDLTLLMWMAVKRTQIEC